MYSRFETMKKNEINFQNIKYGKTLLDEEKHKTTPEKFEQEFLTPKENGGTIRGNLFGRAIEKLLTEDIKGKRILDCCCGRGDLALYLSQIGMEVYGFDISEKAIEVARYKASSNKQDIKFDVMDAENLEYTDNFFDYIIGFEALHHIILYKNVPAELQRVLRENGKIIFAENWGYDNIILQFFRKAFTLKKNSSATRGEVILNEKIVTENFRNYFGNIVIEPFSFIYILKKIIKNRMVLKIFKLFDKHLMKLFPLLSNYCGESVIIFTK